MIGKMRMKKSSAGKLLLILVTLGIPGLAAGRTITENFDEYADQAAFEAVWVKDYANSGILSSVNPLGTGNCVLTNTAVTVASNTRDFGDLETGIAKVTVYDSLTDEPLQILFMSNGATYQFAEITIDPRNNVNYYMTRFYNFSGEIGGMVSTTVGRTLGAHEFEVVWRDTGVVGLYIDDVLVRESAAVGNTAGFDAIGVGKAILPGSGTLTANAVDNISITPVPEPTTLSLLFAGATFLGWRLKRRRKA